MSMLDEQPIPPKFWSTFTREEFREFVMHNGVLNAEQCARLWRLDGRRGKPPKSLQIMVSVEDLMREFPPRPPQ